MLDDLSSLWEEDSSVRRRARQSRQLVHWPSPKAVGVASLSPGIIY